MYSRMSKTGQTILLLLCSWSIAALSGCGWGIKETGAAIQASAVQGFAYAGQQPIAHSLIQVYAAGNGEGSAAIPLLIQSDYSDEKGHFDIPAFTCPSASTPIWIVASGGNPAESAAGANNAALVLMLALGPCGSLTASTSIQVNERTTVAAAFGLAPFMRSYRSLGVSAAEAQQLADAFTMAGELAITQDGGTYGLGAGQAAPVQKLNSLANIVSSCVQSAGGVSGDGSACGSFFAYVAPAQGSPATDTASALLQLAANPAHNVQAIFNLAPAKALFQPTLASSPSDWTIQLQTSVPAPSLSPGSGTFSFAQSVTLADSLAGAHIFYTVDGSTPSASSIPYTGAIDVATSKTVRAVAISAGMTSLFALGSYNINPPHLVLLTQPQTAVAGAPLLIGPTVAFADANGAILSNLSEPVSLALGNSTGAGVLTGTVTVAAERGTASFADVAISQPGTYSLVASASGVAPITSSSISVSGTLAVSLPSNEMTVGDSNTGIVSLGTPAPPAGVTVTLVSSDSTVLKIASPTIHLAAGQTSATFSYTAVGSGTAIITASAPLSSSANGTVSAAALPVPANFFGLSVSNFKQVAPLLTYGTTRSWDVVNLRYGNTPGIQWPQISTSRGSYNFSALESLITSNQVKGIDVIYTFGLTPQWASASPNHKTYYQPGMCAPPAQISDWDAWITAIASYARGRIKYWELWNEPNDPNQYCGDMPTMVILAQHASRIIKSIDPNAVILSPAVVSDGGPAWLDSFLEAGGGAYVDMIAFHGYWSTTAEDISSVVAGYRSILAKYNLGSLPLWDTEASWAGRSGGVGGLTDLNERSAFLAKSYLLHWSLGVTRFVWYEYDGDTQWGQLWDPVGGLHQDGYAYHQVRKWMLGASLSAPCSHDANSTWTCKFTRPGGYSAEVVWNSTANRPFAVAPTYTQYRDMQGLVHPVVGDFIIAQSMPVLLASGPLPIRKP